MISVTEATDIIKRSVQALKPATVPLHKAVGLKLAADLYGAVDIPAFPQSSMDGYAFSFDGWQQHTKLIIDGEMAAGSHHLTEVKPYTAARIFTGAPVPAGADTVVMQEKIRIVNGRLLIEDINIQQGSNVRLQGSEIKGGALALAKESLLTPAALGFLAGVGIAEVTVCPHPSVTIIVTGNELQQPGEALLYGQVYESNSVALSAALQSMGIRNVNVEKVHDDADAVTALLKKCLQKTDMVLLTGGVSVGDYDFVVSAAGHCGVHTLFHKIKQRPGKPLYFGKKDNRIVFGLPGNPSSVLTCFYLHVVPALRLLSGKEEQLQMIKVPLGQTYKKAAGLTHFLKGRYDGKTASIQDAQESYRMQSFAQSNCLIQIDEAVTDCKQGTMVSTHLLPA